jgi:hypothetical protein
MKEGKSYFLNLKILIYFFLEKTNIKIGREKIRKEDTVLHLPHHLVKVVVEVKTTKNLNKERIRNKQHNLQKNRNF